MPDDSSLPIGGRNPPIGQVVARVVVKPDDQNPSMMACGSDDQVMEVFEIFGILSQNRETVGDRVDHHSRIRDGQQARRFQPEPVMPLSAEL